LTFESERDVGVSIIQSPGNIDTYEARRRTYYLSYTEGAGSSPSA